MIITLLYLCQQLLTNPYPVVQVTPNECLNAKQAYQEEINQININDESLDALARIAYAEASTQGVDGLAAVIYTIFNRTISSDFPNTIEEVINQKNQFEPITKVGHWKKLKTVTDLQKGKIKAIIELAKSSHLDDLTNAALFFQNTDLVQQRENKNMVSRGLTHFNNSRPVAKIKDHTFYNQINTNQ